MDATEEKLRAKAKSRLKKSSPPKKIKRSLKVPKLKSNWRALALTLISWILIYLLISFSHPSKIQHFILPNSYLPFIFLLFFGFFFLFLFIFNKKN